MRRIPGRVLLVAAACVAGVAIGLLWLSGESGGPGPGRAPGDALSVTTDVRPRTHALGDRIVAEAVVVVDRSVVETKSVELDASFEPYEPAGPPSVERSEAGSVGRVRFRYPLVCLRAECVADEGRRVVDLPLGRVLYRFRGHRGQAVGALDWPPFEVTPRVGPEDLRQRRWLADQGALPAVSYRAGPVTTAVVLLLLSLALAVAAGFLVWRLGLLGRGPSAAAAAVGPDRSPLERALELAREASVNGAAPERRKALERVARELGGVSLGELAERARRLAWSTSGPTVGAVDELARDAESAVRAQAAQGQVER